MNKFFFTFICFTLMTASVSAQRLQLRNVVELFSVMFDDPANAEVNVTKALKASSPGWQGPVVNNDGGYTASWQYLVGDATYGWLRFIIQRMPDGGRLPKVSYECPFTGSYTTFSEELKKLGAVLEDSYVEDDGGIANVFTLNRYTMILSQVPLEKSRYTVDGKKSAYFRFLMHPSLD